MLLHMTPGCLETKKKLKSLKGISGVYIVWISVPNSFKRTAIYLGRSDDLSSRVGGYMTADGFALNSSDSSHAACLELRRQGADIVVE